MKWTKRFWIFNFLKMKPNSLMLIAIAVVLLLAGKYADNLYLRYGLLLASILISIYAVVRSFQEKKRNRS